MMNLPGEKKATSVTLTVTLLVTSGSTMSKTTFYKVLYYYEVIQC